MRYMRIYCISIVILMLGGCAKKVPSDQDIINEVKANCDCWKVENASKTGKEIILNLYDCKHLDIFDQTNAFMEKLSEEFNGLCELDKTLSFHFVNGTNQPLRIVNIPIQTFCRNR